MWVNRASEPWTTAGRTLPKDGFYAETAGARAGIVELAGRRCAFSECGGTVFVDGRPDRNDGTGPADTANATALADFAPLGIKTDGAFRLERDGDRALLLTPILRLPHRLLTHRAPRFSFSGLSARIESAFATTRLKP